MVSGVTLLVSSCSVAERRSFRRLAQPEDITNRSEGMHSLWMGAWLAAAIVGVVVWGLIGYACVKYRRRRDDEIPVQTRYNLPIEILYTVAPVVMVLVFFFFTDFIRGQTGNAVGYLGAIIPMTEDSLRADFLPVGGIEVSF